VSNWFVVKTQPRREQQVQLVLSSRGIEAYLPMIRRRGRLSGSNRSLEPLFPSYLFAHLDITTNAWLMSRSAPGVEYFLGVDGKPSAIPDELVDSIKARVAMQLQADPLPRFRPGERVIIEGGPLDGYEALFSEQLSAQGRVRVLLEIVNRLVAVDLNAASLRRAG
jgi:transcriptional antiterminator RfaH